jgi:hypothetical protein
VECAVIPASSSPEANRHQRAGLSDQLLAMMDAVATAKISHAGSAL